MCDNIRTYFRDLALSRYELNLIFTINNQLSQFQIQQKAAKITQMLNNCNHGSLRDRQSVFNFMKKEDFVPKEDAKFLINHYMV